MMVALLNLSRLRFYILSFLFCTVTARADATAYTYRCSTGECTSLNASNFHLYIENLQALENWTEQEYKKRPSGRIAYTADLSNNCPSGGAFNATSQMTKLVMMANPRCQNKNDPRYYVEILGDHNSNSDYRIDINPGSPTLETYYKEQNNYCINKATTIDRQNLFGTNPKGASFTALVTARMTTQDIYDSDADVLVRVIPEGYYDGVIYIAYNNTDGTDYCTQMYTPLLAEHIKSHVDGTLVTVQWREQDHSDGYIVAVGDDKGQCTSQRPCLIIKNTTRVTINFTDGLSKIQIYNIITTNCTNPEIADKLVHLFKGCTDDCCSTTHYHDPTSVKATTGSTMYNTTLAMTESDCDTTEGGISSTAFYPIDHKNSTVTTNDGSSSNTFNPNGSQNPLVIATSFSSSMSIETKQINVLQLVIAVTVGTVAIIAI